MTEITIPYKWSPRSYQLPFFQAMSSGVKRACLVYHRRAGKDSMSLNFTASMMLKRKGIYWHCLPKIAQARKAIWNGIDGQGRKIIDQAFPLSIRKRTNEQEMLIELKNGSIWQLVGSDNYDAMVGSNPVGIVFSEYSISNPQAWDYFRPMLAENGGWAVFIYTARGKNHGYQLYKMAKKTKEWFCELLTVNDTKRDDGSPVIGPEIIQQERDEGMSEEKIQQEYFCSFDAQIPGAIYSTQLSTARDDHRILSIPVDPMLEVHTAWDLGISDAMSIWFFQTIGNEIRLIHYYENHNEGMEHYIQYLQEFKAKHKIHYGQHLAPHDIEVRELSTGKTRKSTAARMGIVFRTVQRPRAKSEGHGAVRKIFPRLYIDDTRAEHGLNCLASYQYEWDDKKGVFKDQPLHDWASHGADALQTLALGWNEQNTHKPPPKAGSMKVEFNVFG
jgi:phage terminase large subunit